MRNHKKGGSSESIRNMSRDWDKYSSSSSIVILEYNVKMQQFMVLKRFEMPRAEYSYDNAVNTVIELNKIYNPAWIYADRGSGEIPTFYSNMI